jgi:hypothetical protein
MRRVVLLIAIAAASLITPATAQSPQRDDPVSQADMRRVADDLGQCVTATYTDTSRRIVLEPVAHSEIFRRFWVEFSGHCLNENDVAGAPVQMRFPWPTVHAILADNLIRRDFRDSGPTDLTAVPAMAPLPAPALPSISAMADMSERERNAVIAEASSNDAWNTLQRVGICTARRAPEPVRQLALTRVGSDEERGALRGMAQHVGACVPIGASLRLRPAELRWAVALGYYRLARAAAAAPQGTP